MNLFSRMQARNCAKAAALLSDTRLEISEPFPSTLPLKSNPVLAGLYQRYAEEMGEIISNHSKYELRWNT